MSDTFLWKDNENRLKYFSERILLFKPSVNEPMSMFFVRIRSALKT